MVEIILDGAIIVLDIVIIITILKKWKKGK